MAIKFAATLKSLSVNLNQPLGQLFSSQWHKGRKKKKRAQTSSTCIQIYSNIIA